MIGLLPDLTPRDSHSVWYTSSRNPLQNPFLEPTQTPGDWPTNQNELPQRRHGQAAIERSQLARLRADEQYRERRLANIQNFGAGWLRPPGVTKTLHQRREEEREAAEHAEAMRREQVQAELAEAEAGGGEELLDGESALDEMGDGARDLDDDIPDADASAMGMSGIEDVSEVSSDPVSSDVEDENEENERAAEERETELIQARMRMGNDSFRQAMARGDADAGDLYGAEEELEAEDDGQLLLEEDSSAAHFNTAREQLLDEDEGDLDMEADLDGSIPEAGQMSGVYEHTDSEAELSSSLPSSSRSSSNGDRGQQDVDDGFFPRSSAAPLGMPTSPTLMARGAGRGQHHASHNSMDLSSLLSGGESSVLDSSPQRR
ncbi:Apc15p protein-domain-containing protein [Plectosphaerella plurivora]|uniref:Apc15p protein-domain-containing protein n=1 Tax=Plectosphaerella plurivora TaxID=936078 RepID=A0A9P9A963_9PEZI|nr:Apc15p protein-domain-containing protein [Plectosphaerella plurivora]